MTLASHEQVFDLGEDKYALTLWNPQLDGVFLGHIRGTIPQLALQALKNFPSGPFQLQYVSANRVITMRRATLFAPCLPEAGLHPFVTCPGLVIRIEEVNPKQDLVFVYPGDTYSWSQVAIEWDGAILSRYTSTSDHPIIQYTGFEDYREAIRESIREQAAQEA